MKLIPYIKAAQAVKPEHPLLGQPVDAADVDEDDSRYDSRSIGA